MFNTGKKNKFNAICNLCSSEVKKGEGIVFALQGRSIGFGKNKKPVWVVQHKYKRDCKKNY